MIRNMDSAGINGLTADSTSASGRMENNPAMANMSLLRALSRSDAGIRANAPSGSLNRKLVPLKLTLFLNDSLMTLNIFKRIGRSLELIFSLLYIWMNLLSFNMHDIINIFLYLDLIF